MGDKNRVWERVFNLIRLATGNVDVVNKGDLQTQVDDLDESLSICLKNTGIVDIKNKGNLQKQVNDLDKEVQKCFQSASNGKELIADAVTGKGVPTLGSDTFAIMAENIKKIKTEPRLQNKTVVLDVETHSAAIEADKDYDGIEKATASITLQEKTVELSTVGQVIVPDSGMVLSKVNIPAIDGNASQSDVLAERTFGSGNGVKLTGTMPDNGAWICETTGSGKVIIPSGYHNGSGYVSGEGAYNAGVSAGAAGTKIGTAAAGDVLAGKTFTNAESAGVTGTMSDNGGKTVEAYSVTNEGGYIYLAVPSTGYYDTDSVIKIQNQNLAEKVIKPAMSEIASGLQTQVKSFPAAIGKYYLVLRGHLANESASSYLSLQIESGGVLVSEIKWKSGLKNFWEGRSTCAIIKATSTTITMNEAVNYVCLTDS